MKRYYKLFIILTVYPINSQNTPPVTYYSDFMYFSQSEIAGGGLYSGEPVYFYSTNFLEGYLYSQSDVYIQSCPTLADSSIFYTSGNFVTSNCGDRFIENVDSIYIPQVQVLYPYIDTYATHTIDGGAKMNRPSLRDTLLMTNIDFDNNGFMISQWEYLIPPVYTHKFLSMGYPFDTDTTLLNIDLGFVGFNSFYNVQSGYLSTTEIYINQLNIYLDDELEIQSNDTLIFHHIDQNIVFLVDSISTIDQGVSSTLILYTNVLEQDLSTPFFNGDSIIIDLIPPLDTSIDFNNAYYYHNHVFDNNNRCTRRSMHHFDFPEPDSLIGYYLEPTYYESSQSIIYVKQGQVLVSGKVNGEHAIITDLPTIYKTQHINVQDSLFNNIWIIDDLIYEDSDTTSGMVVEGTINRLFLISGSNVIVANTLKNGGGNSSVNQNVLINGCIIALNESFTSHYWQNTTQSYGNPNPSNPSLSFGDGRGTSRMGVNTTQFDDRGTINLWGSIFQKHRGHVRRHSPDGYNIQVPGIGYSKSYHYDSNMFNNIPFYFQDLLQIPTPPTVIFLSDVSEGNYPLSVQFTDYSTGCNLLYSVVGWYWNFGDDSVSYEQNPLHIYNNEGQYDVFLEVTDIIGQKNQLFIPNYITVYPPVNIENELSLPEKYTLHQNYPNPFNPITTLRYDLPENSYVNVTVYDMLGREVKTLVSTTQDAGFKSVIWDATNNQGKPVSAGVYLYQIQAGEFVQTKKMVLLK